MPPLEAFQVSMNNRRRNPGGLGQLQRPSGFVGVRIDVGPPPPFAFEAELARAMRHQ